MPEIAIGFWIIKIVAASLGWTTGQLIAGTLGDSSPHASIQLNLIIAAIAAIGLLVLVYMQVNARKFDRWIFWLTFVAGTVCAIAIEGLAQSANAGAFPLGAIVLLACFGLIFFAWRKALGTIDIEMVGEAPVQAFYWAAMVLGQALGFQLGDQVAAAGVGYAGAAALFGLIVAAIGYAHFRTSANEVLLFWAAIVLTCPLSVGLADFLFKPLGHGGLAFSPIGGAAVLALAVAALAFILPPRSAGHTKEGRSRA